VQKYEINFNLSPKMVKIFFAYLQTSGSQSSRLKLLFASSPLLPFMNENDVCGVEEWRDGVLYIQ
jgi:hypothetical protein